MEMSTLKRNYFHEVMIHGIENTGGDLSLGEIAKILVDEIRSFHNKDEIKDILIEDVAGCDIVMPCFSEYGLFMCKEYLQHEAYCCAGPELEKIYKSISSVLRAQDKNKTADYIDSISGKIIFNITALAGIISDLDARNELAVRKFARYKWAFMHELPHYSAVQLAKYYATLKDSTLRDSTDECNCLLITKNASKAGYDFVESFEEEEF